jgi:alanine racemase
MQRFACPPEEVDGALTAGECTEAFTHATRPEHAQMLQEIAGNRGARLHAAASSLLDEPSCWLDAVRPGLALYAGAVRISTRLIEAKFARGPIGYGGFAAECFGVIPCGYSHGLQPGPCRINGRARVVLEVGMQSAYVWIDRQDNVGDEVVLLGDGLEPADIAQVWKTSPHEVLVHLARAGARQYSSPPDNRKSPSP